MIYTAQPTRPARNRADAEPHRPTQPERKLMGAVLTTAFDDLLDQRCSPEAEARRQTARAWIAGASARVTFEAVCQALDLDAATVRDAAARPLRTGRPDAGRLSRTGGVVTVRHCGFPR